MRLSPRFNCHLRSEPAKFPMTTTSILPPNKACAIHLQEAVQSAPAGIVSRTVLSTDDARVVLFSFAEGQELTAHTNRRRALVQILEGECDFQFGGEWHRLAAGTLLHLPPNDPHAVRAGSGPFSMLLTLCSECSGDGEVQS